MQRIFKSFFFILLAAGSGYQVFAQKYLTGELAGSYPAGEYSISGNIYVLPKTTLTFESGSILRFDNFTGIIVRGNLVCKGTADEPIIFTSSRDIPHGRTAAEAFDWNGIKVTEEAQGITLENCTIAYSTFGLNIESASTPVLIKETVFHNNGSASLTREKKMMSIVDNIPTSQSWPESGGGGQPVPDTGTTPHRDTTKIVSPRPSGSPAAHPKWLMPVRISLGGLAVAGGVLWITGHLRAEHFNTLLNPLPSNQETEKQYLDSRNSSVLLRNIGIGIFCVGALGFAVTLLF